MGSPSRFNDPFDSKVAIDFSEAKEEYWRQVLQAALKDEQEVERKMALKLYEDSERQRRTEVGLQTYDV